MSASDVSRKVLLRRISAWISLWLSLGPGVALAQANQCRLPPRLEVPDVRQPDNEPSRVVPVTGYTLAVSWSPQYCRSHPNEGQCEPANGRFGFILHGLWPEGAGSSYPQWCAATQPLPETIVRAQFCTQPSPRLMAHEWAKHGTCATHSPADYFAASRKLFASIRFPDMNALSRRRLDVGGFKRLMSSANPRVMPSAITMSTERSGDWLREVRICLDKAMMPAPCPRGRSGGAPDGAPVRIWRGRN